MTKLEQAARQALEALEAETHPDWGCSSYHPKIYPAIESLRKALEQQAARELEGGPPGSGGWKAHAEAMERERDHYRQRAQTMYEHREGEAWYWQGDGDDHLESMVNSLPVVIRADQLRALVASKAPQQAKQEQVRHDTGQACPFCAAGPHHLCGHVASAMTAQEPSDCALNLCDPSGPHEAGCYLAQKQAAQERQPLPEWQPIETAPKETEVFIGAFIDGVFKFGRSEMFYERANNLEGEMWSGWAWSIDDCDDSVAEMPTHWMPLPAPPIGDPQ